MGQANAFPPLLQAAGAAAHWRPAECAGCTRRQSGHRRLRVWPGAFLMCAQVTSYGYSCISRTLLCTSPLLSCSQLSNAPVSPHAPMQSRLTSSSTRSFPCAPCIKASHSSLEQLSQCSCIVPLSCDIPSLYSVPAAGPPCCLVKTEGLQFKDFGCL